ncbi:flagellar hook-associated protein FlgL [Gracilibacillus salinarum]|uniref:Flagellar hook-associated protein FlgL n=1 Tax=Gracilibacillus salinarum TaxID=2932255 RepID=A0ABY4GLW8_9BACI|nr:flagellar hook-associated protein FlgL [Gracilibacillus salinarum]UOQ85170.1 flagellar hook-associated protein FlgL [Gracilibacillus salinarum]
MRVTQSMITYNTLRNISSSYGKLDEYMNQLATGKKINRPSDDPVIAMRGMNYRTEVANAAQYERNLNEVNTWMDNSDAALDEATQALQKLRELAVQASNGTYEEDQRENIAEEVDQLKEQLIDIANTKVNNKYLFNGTGTTGVENADGDLAGPVQTDEDGNVISVASNNSDVNIEVLDGVKIKVNSDAENSFNEDLFKDIEAFSQALKNDDQEAISQSIEAIDSHINNVVNERADLGARMNRVELITDRISNQSIAAQTQMAENEDADIEEVITNLTTQESVHRAALSAGARIIQPTLLDFLS